MNALKSNLNLWLYVLHGLFWAAFVLTRWWVGRRAAQPTLVSAPPAPPTQVAGQAPQVQQVRQAQQVPQAQQLHQAPNAKALLAFHSVGFGLLYFALGQAIMTRRVPHLFPGQRMLACVLVLLGAAFACWALLYFRSWRFKAQLDAGHDLATGGPFAWVRHPIYLGLSLLALGSLVWVPTAWVACATVWMLLGADLRARAEEKLLTAGFGAAYTAYCNKTARFVPGLY